MRLGLDVHDRQDETGLTMRADDDAGQVPAIRPLDQAAAERLTVTDDELDRQFDDVAP